MDILDELVEYRNNVKRCATILATLSAISTQEQALYEELIPRIKKLTNVERFMDKGLDADSVKELANLVKLFSAQKDIAAAASSGSAQAAKALKDISDALEVKE
jgi:type II secretory pathway component PulL